MKFFHIFECLLVNDWFWLITLWIPKNVAAFFGIIRLSSETEQVIHTCVKGFIFIS
jgi:hypothetical protein